MDTFPKEINVKIHSLGFGDYDTFRVSPYITVEDLKKLVCQKNDFPLTTIRLLFKGKSLISSSSIYDYGITDDDMLYAVPASRIPPQYLPISFNITIQSNNPVVYHYRPDTRDFDRQINTMRVKIAEIQEACSSALLRISLTQHLLTRRDNPKSIKIPRAIVPSPSSIRTPQESESNTALSSQELPSPSINTIDLSLLSDEDKMKRYEHGCRIVQGKLLEALKAITTNVSSLKQYKVMENHGEMGAVFTREGPLPEPPVLTRDLLITNVTSGLGELFGAPGSNLVPHTIFHFPEDPNDSNSQNNRSNRNDRNHGNRNSQHSNDEIISPTTSQLFPSHMPTPIPSEITNSVVQQARSKVSLKPENQIQNNDNSRRFDDIFDRQRRHRRRRHHRSDRSISHHRIFNLDDDFNFLNSDSDNDSSESDNSDHFNNSSGNENNNKKKKKRNSRSSPLDDLINDDNDSNPISNFIRMHRNRIRRMKHSRDRRNDRSNFDSNSNSDDNDNFNQMSFIDDLINSLNDENQSSQADSNNNNNNEKNGVSKDDQNNDNDNNSHSEYPHFFTQEEVNQLNNDKKMIEESAANCNIPNLNPEYYQTRVLEGY